MTWSFPRDQRNPRRAKRYILYLRNHTPCWNHSALLRCSHPLVCQPRRLCPCRSTLSFPRTQVTRRTTSPCCCFSLPATAYPKLLSCPTHSWALILAPLRASLVPNTAPVRLCTPRGYLQLSPGRTAVSCCCGRLLFCASLQQPPTPFPPASIVHNARHPRPALDRCSATDLQTTDRDPRKTVTATLRGSLAPSACSWAVLPARAAARVDKAPGGTPVAATPRFTRNS